MPFDDGDISTSKFNPDGKFRTATGTDDLQGVDGALLSLPPDTDGLSDFQEGDELDVHIKGRVGKTNEDGQVEIEPINIDVQGMPAEAKQWRRDQKNSMPPPQTMGKDEGDM